MAAVLYEKRNVSKRLRASMALGDEEPSIFFQIGSPGQRLEGETGVYVTIEELEGLVEEAREIRDTPDIEVGWHPSDEDRLMVALGGLDASYLLDFIGEAVTDRTMKPRELDSHIALHEALKEAFDE